MFVYFSRNAIQCRPTITQPYYGSSRILRETRTRPCCLSGFMGRTLPAPPPGGKPETGGRQAERRSVTGWAVSGGPKPTPSRRSARLLSSLGRSLAPPNAPVRCIARYGRWYCTLYSVLVQGGAADRLPGLESKGAASFGKRGRSWSEKEPPLWGQRGRPFEGKGAKPFLASGRPFSGRRRPLFGTAAAPFGLRRGRACPPLRRAPAVCLASGAGLCPRRRPDARPGGAYFVAFHLAGSSWPLVAMVPARPSAVSLAL